ncbi:MAG: sensor histidine kinase [Vulcanimicrobiaceae bacterium]
MTHSLRWRIAAWYALLLILAISAVGGLIAWRFQTILYQEARARIAHTMTEIVSPSPELFSLEDLGLSPLDRIISSSSISTWASPTTFIEIDTTKGQVLNKSTNLGSGRFPPNLSVSPKHPRSFRQVNVGTAPFLVESRYLSLGSGQAAIVRVGEPLDALRRTFQATQQTLAVILLGTAAAVILLSMFLATQAINPIVALARAMHEIGSDRLDRRIAWGGRDDEIGRLAASFNDLLARLEEAFARERQFISDASHELKTPLTSINANAQLLLRWGEGDPQIRRESLETIARESTSLAAMVNGMLTLARADRGDAIPKEPVSLAYVAGEAVRATAHRAAAKGLSLRFDPGSGNSIVLGDESLLRQSVSNLIDNAIKFTEAGTIEVRVGAQDGEAWVEVSDSGPGIATEDLPHIFERFYRADKARSREIAGMGLGLAIVRSIARVHDGRVEATSHPGEGTSFRVTLPQLDPILTEPS